MSKKITIPKNCKEFANAKFKKFKKDEGPYTSSKKELKSMYYTYLFEFLPDTIEFLVRFGHIKTDEIEKIKNNSYEKFTDPDFTKYLIKTLKNGDEIRNIKLFPIILSEIIVTVQKMNAELMEKYEAAKKENPEAKEPSYYSLDKVTELSQFILSKKMKKLTKEGFSKELAFNVLSVIPCKAALQWSQYYRLSQFINTLYTHSSTEPSINFSKLVEMIFPKDKYGMIITFSLLERKEKFTKLDDNQKVLWVSITTWCFNTMEAMSKEDIEAILYSYCKGRKKDDQAGKDGNRRYAITSLFKDDYPRITKVANRIDDSLKEYL